MNSQSAHECAALYGIPQVVENFEQILADASINAVVICSSTDTHAPFITLAAQAGKHIFCEKPIAAELSAIDSALTGASMPMFSGLNRRSTLAKLERHNCCTWSAVTLPRHRSPT